MSMQDNKYTCINCGHKVKELYKVYSPTVLKLSTCNSCNLVVDKYIEYDPIIIIIDLVLLNREAYRHVLFNTECTFHWKLLVILELMEAYWELSWNTKPHSILLENDTKKKPIMLDKFYAGDLEYYQSLLKVICRNVFFVLVIFSFTIIRAYANETCSNKNIVNQVMKCITLSSFGIFLFLPSLIWEKHGTEEYHFVFVVVYTTLSQLVAYTVLCECSKLWSIIVILCAYAVKIRATHWFNVTF